jgi:hypothetical protein
MTDSEIIQAVERAGELRGMTVNERLFNTGLMEEFDFAKKYNKPKARRILQLIGVDEPSINEIMRPFIVQVFKAIFRKQ